MDEIYHQILQFCHHLSFLRESKYKYNVFQISGYQMGYVQYDLISINRSWELKQRVYHHEKHACGHLSLQLHLEDSKYVRPHNILPN